MKGGAGAFDFLEDVGSLCGPARHPLVWGSILMLSHGGGGV